MTPIEKRAFQAHLTRLLAVLSIVLLTGCSPGYFLRAAYEQSKILIGRRQINLVMLDPETTQEHREKLQLVLDARLYAEQMGLTPGGSFKSYVEVSRDPLAWVVVASKRDAFALHTWWFPIVGQVPYKGFFSKEDAEAQIRALEQDGYEASMRGTEAFSTLGWFDDPLVSTTLKNGPTRIANTVIHESVHTTVWISGGVEFNESLANFIGSEGAVSFFKSRVEGCRAALKVCAIEEQRLQMAQRERAFQFELSEVIEALYKALEQLYQDPSLTTAEKLTRRVEVFASVVDPFRKRHPTMTILKQVNNADIIQLQLYLSNLELFQDLLTLKGGEWGPFMGSIREIQERLKEDPSRDPFVVLRDIVGKGS